MADRQDPRCSDQATGLPPLEQIGPDDYPMLVLDWMGGEGIVVSPHTEQTIPVRYLHLRGLVRSDEPGATAEWVQFHIAVPAEVASLVAATLTAGYRAL